MGSKISAKKVSSYQKLKVQKTVAESELMRLQEDIEHMIEYPYSIRSVAFRRELKIKLDLV